MIGIEEEEIDFEATGIDLAPAIYANFEYKNNARNIPSERPERGKPNERGGHKRESDERRLAGRQKQIDYGKNTAGYREYIESVPRYIVVRHSVNYVQRETKERSS